MKYPPITIIEQLEAIYAAAGTGDEISHEHDADGMVTVYRGGRELFRATPERHRVLLAVLDLEAREFVSPDEGR